MYSGSDETTGTGSAGTAPSVTSSQSTNRTPSTASVRSAAEPGTAAVVKENAGPSYRNPANAAETWSGRGRKPKWVIEWLEAGNSLEKLLAEK